MHTTTETAEAVKAEAPITKTRLVTLVIGHITELVLPETMTIAERIALLGMLERCRLLRDRYDTASGTYVYTILETSPDVSLNVGTRLIEEDAK